MSPADINSSLKSLKRVKKGDRIRSAVSSDRLNAIQDLIRAFARGDNVVTGPRIRKIIHEGHFILSADKQGGRRGGGTEPDFPYRVIARLHGDEPNQTLQFGVIHDSHVFISDDLNSYDEPNDDWGLLTQDIESDAGWMDVTAQDYGKKIWLEMEFNEQLEVESIAVRFATVQTEGGWTNYPDPIEINIDDPEHPYQQFYHQVIAELTNPDEDYRDGDVYGIPNTQPLKSIQVTQLLHENIMLVPAHTTGTANEPNVQIYVNSATYDAGTDTAGNAMRIPDSNDLMTPWQNGMRENIWNFRILDATNDTGPGVVILDGMFNGETPPQMGSDNFRLDITEWDETDGEVDIVLTVDYELDGTFHNDEAHVDLTAVKPENYPEDEPGHKISIGLGVAYVDQTPNGPKVVEVRNTWLGDIDVQLAPLEVYAFQMFDSSTADNGASVRIFDGDVIDQDGGGHTPTDMGNDDFIADNLQDGDTFFVQITHDEHFNITEDVTIEWEQEVPPDTDTVSNIEFGYVEVFPPSGPNETVAQVIPHNTMCGDIFFDPPPPDDVQFDFKLEDASDGATAQILLYDGAVYGPNDGDAGDGDIQGMQYGNNTILPVQDGDEIWLEITWDQEQDDGISGDNITQVVLNHGPTTPDDVDLTIYITLGDVEVSFDDNGDAFVDCFNQVCGDISIPYPPRRDTPQAAYLKLDVDTGNVVWKKSGIRVSGQTSPTSEDTDYDNIDAIRFEPADDPSAGYIEVVDEDIDIDGYHVATIKVPILPVIPEGETQNVLGNDGGDIQWFSTTDCSQPP